jgi:hypothetical protein
VAAETDAVERRNARKKMRVRGFMRRDYRISIPFLG